MNETELRTAIRAAGVPQWQIAREMGIHETALSKMLREDVPDKDGKKILQAIETVGARERLGKMSYNAILALKKEDPELYERLMNPEGNVD